MGKFDGILLATDLDGTLLKTDKTVSPLNAEAIRYFQSEGGLFTAATGRYPDFLNTYTDFFKVNECVIGLNGNMIYDLSNKKMLFVSKMEKDALKNVIDYMMSAFGNFISFTDINAENEMYHYEGSLKHNPCKAVVVTDSAQSALKIKADLTKKYGHLYKFVRSWDVGLEIFDIKSGKGECIDYIKKYVNPNIRKTVCVGDYENDISMLTHADIGYAVKNAVSDVKAVADKITEVDNNNDAIAWVINDLEKEGI